MVSKRLILVPQLPIRMRYQEWWPEDFIKHLQPAFDEIVVLGQRTPVEVRGKNFSVVDIAIKNETEQANEYMSMKLFPSDVLLHCDLSFPGIFHSALFHHKPGRAVVFCHASAKNRYDVFQPVRAMKWGVEKAVAGLYDKVLVATKYHKTKLGLKNVVSLGGLPNPPAHLLPDPAGATRTFLLCSTARPSCQKVDRTVEREVQRLSGKKIHRHRFLDWKGYYQFLDRCHFLLVTSKEETYGYQIIDALLRGCTPIAPRAYSYLEILPGNVLYDPESSPKDKSQQIMSIVNKHKGWKCHPRNGNDISKFYPRLIKELTRD